MDNLRNLTAEGWMLAATPPRRHAAIRFLQWTLATLTGGTLVLHAATLGTLNVNWDEFYFLSIVHEYDRGALSRLFQTFHVHLYSWLARIRGDEIDQIVAARQVAFGLHVATALCVFLLCDRMFARTGALFAVLSYVAFPYVLHHGSSFRADPVIALLFAVAVLMLVLRRDRPWAIAAAGGAFAMATAVSVKALLYGPTLMVLVALTGPCGAQQRRGIRGVALFWAAVLAVFAALVIAHVGQVSGGAGVSSLSAQLAWIARSMWLSAPLRYVQTTLQADTAFWGLAASGAILAFGQVLVGRRSERCSAAMLLALALPVVALAMYRNAFPYFYVCVIPFVAVVCGFAVATIEARVGSYQVAALLVVAALAAQLVAQGWTEYQRMSRTPLSVQRALLDGVHQIFPEKVPYIDRCGMVAQFPKVGPFMSTLVMDSYRHLRKPIMTRVVETSQPVFVLANVDGLDLSRDWSELGKSPYHLLREDFLYLQNHYIRHWGPVWVAGKTLQPAAGEEVSFDIAVAGAYTLEAQVPVELDGIVRQAGQVVYLAVGPHKLSSPRSGTVTLRHGNHRVVPAFAPPEEPFFIPLSMR